MSEWRKLSATAVVAGFFLYFWISGPLVSHEPVLRNEEEVTEYARPFMLEEGVNIESARFGEIALHEETHSYFGLLGIDGQRNYWSLLNFDEHFPGLSHAQYKEVRKHAIKLSQTDSNTLEVKPAPDMYYAQLKTPEPLLYMESKGVVKHVRGYAGPVHIGVFVRPNGTIASLHHISSLETASYLRDIEQNGFYKRFQGLKLDAVHEVDAVSGATLTTEAIGLACTELVQTAKPLPLTHFSRVDEISDFATHAILGWGWILHILVIASLFAYGMQKKWKKSRRGMWVSAGLSVAYIGFFLNNSFTYITFIHPFAGTALSAFTGIYAFLVLLGAIWGKNTYCKYVCPFGNAQRLMLKLDRNRHSKPFFLSNRVVARLRDALAVVLISGFLLGMRSWSNYELFPDLFGAQFVSVWFLISAALILINLRYPLIWCRLLCPTGAVLDGLSALSESRTKSHIPAFRKLETLSEESRVRYA
ncbi:MAG: 4Fe-4S binding protein [Flavobacteriales bacterium]|nr:4Fe-4S binding protein [Flavobacteriales bacterium]